MSGEFHEYEEEEGYEDEEEGANGWISLNSWTLVWVIAAVALILFKGPFGLRFGPIKVSQWYLANGLLATIIIGVWGMLTLYTKPRRDPGSGETVLKLLILLHVAFLLATQLPIQTAIQ